MSDHKRRRLVVLRQGVRRFEECHDNVHDFTIDLLEWIDENRHGDTATEVIAHMEKHGGGDDAVQVSVVFSDERHARHMSGELIARATCAIAAAVMRRGVELNEIEVPYALLPYVALNAKRIRKQPISLTGIDVFGDMLEERMAEAAHEAVLHAEIDRHPGKMLISAPLALAATEAFRAIPLAGLPLEITINTQRHLPDIPMLAENINAYHEGSLTVRHVVYPENMDAGVGVGSVCSDSESRIKARVDMDALQRASVHSVDGQTFTQFVGVMMEYLSTDCFTVVGNKGSPCSINLTDIQAPGVKLSFLNADVHLQGAVVLGELRMYSGRLTAHASTPPVRVDTVCLVDVETDVAGSSSQPPLFSKAGAFTAELTWASAATKNGRALRAR